MYPAIDKKKTGKLLAELMRHNGLTPKDICDYLSLSCVQTVYRWFEGINIPSIDNLYALSQLFHMQIDDMIVGDRLSANKEIVSPEYRRLWAYVQKLRDWEAA